MLSVTVKITGDQKIQRKLQRLGASINDLSGAMRIIGEKAIQYYATVGFTDRGRPYGSSWPAYSLAYQKQLDSRSNAKFSMQGNTMLVRTGTMQGSFFAQSGRNSVIIDNRAPYYKYHQSSAPRTKMPYRPMAGVNGMIKRMVSDAIRQDIIKKLEGV